LTVSKPIQSTLLSFALFLVISYTLVAMCLVQVLEDQQPPWYVYLVLGVLTPLSIFLTYRVFINYKVIVLANDLITVRYPVLSKVKNYPLDSVIHWQEVIVKTGKTSTFKEIEILFDDHFKLSLGLKEYSNYPKVYNYLMKKLSRKKLND